MDKRARDCYCTSAGIDRLLIDLVTVMGNRKGNDGCGRVHHHIKAIYKINSL